MDTLNNLIANFSADTLKQFFRQKISTFKPEEEDYEYLFEDNENIIDNYEDIVKIGEADLINSDDLLVITAKTLAPLTNRTGKKRQFEIAKKILKEENKDAAFFIFYGDNGNFRFSLIRVNFLGAKKDFTDFKRYTYFVSREFTNKTFKSQISKADFNDLGSIQEAFSVEPITKQFYEKLQYWYFWAIDNVEFPDDAEEEPNGREVAIIRLITRLMFIWFMKVRGLIPGKLFDEEKTSEILKDFSPDHSTYYKAILQNLFFATLNTKQKERKFRSEKRGAKGYNPDFGNHNVYRYHNLFKDNKLLNTLFSKIPFLNGGLFECLDYKPTGKEKDEKKYIDGFTATKKHQPTIPNFLFFSEIQKVDISSFFGTTKKLYEVQGLINLLNSYNFTIDENEPDDIEVALDPELLGSIFENLLASYNPETATTARKATGSFYTPREIVNYMTSESLKQYFTTSLQNNNIADLDNNLTSLISSNNSDNPFAPETTKNIINLINDLRVVDPAVGSGAFPMAILNKLVFILSKLDLDNTFWQESQINGIKKSISDPVLQRKLIEQIKRQFKEKNADYGRKLYLIEKCIYGVDIQQIAVEIAKLRFFISLLVDEKIDFDKPENNYGIEPLPNLDFKLMQGNSLISTFAGIDFNSTEKQTENLLFDIDEPYKLLIKEFEELKNEYQNESDKETKDQLRSKIEKSITKIIKEKINQHFPQLKAIKDKAKQIPNKEQKEKYLSKEKQKLSKNLGFDIEKIEKDLIAYTEGRKSKEFFLWNIYFAEVFSQKGGFDVVIGNPPYVFTRDVDFGLDFKKYVRDNYFTNIALPKKSKARQAGKINLFALFILKGKALLKEKGSLIYIIPNNILRATVYDVIRYELLRRNNLLSIVDLGTGIFSKVTASTILLQIGNKIKIKNFKSKIITDVKSLINKQFQIKYIDQNVFLLNTSYTYNIMLKYVELQLSNKIKKDKKEFGEFCIDIIEGIVAHKHLIKERSGNNTFELLEGKDIKRFTINTASNFIVWNKSKIHRTRPDYLWKEEKKIVMQRISGGSMPLVAALDTKKRKTFASTNNIVLKKEYNDYYKFFTGLLNSKLMNWFYANNFSNNSKLTVNISKTFLETLPIPKIPKTQQKPFETLVDKIISKKEASEDTTAEERKIDLMVYKLYELTYEEVKIIEPEFDLTKKEYENYE